MIFRLDLTGEQADDLMNYIGGLTQFQKKTKNGNYISDQYTYISSIELQTDEFLIRYKKYIERSPMAICKGSKEYDVIMKWFKPKMRDYKLEELGI